jgi:antitoxin (DNA-binding transcriptional repressor) of toxin-antitoxin stability system
MNHIIKTATVRDLRYHFSEIEARLQQGEEVEIRKRRRVIARLVPVRLKRAAYPDFAARRKQIFSGRIMKVSGAQRLAEERDKY